MNRISRRTFIRQASCAAVTSASLASTLLDLKMISALSRAEAQSLGGYKGLVCIFLYGGNDGSNTVIPTAPEELNLYNSGRDSLALAPGSLLSLNPLNTGSRPFALHQSLPNLRALFNSGDACIVSNVGTLLAPLTRTEWRNGTAAVPNDLFSHNSQTIQWQTSISDGDSSTGWGGRVADIVNSVNSATDVSMSISLHPQGANSFQVGNSVNLFAVPAEGPRQLEGFGQAPLGGTDNNNDTLVYNALQNILNYNRTNLIRSEYSRHFRESIEKSQALAAALAGVPNFGVTFPETQLGQQLLMVAKLIAIRGPLGLNRQIFFCSDGGYDTHDDQLEPHASLLSELDAAIGAFYSVLVELGLQDQVTTFTASDFGRTFTSNGRGTDHGWGSNHFVVGGAVQGQQFYGTYPEFVLDGTYDAGRGAWIPTTSVDQYSATLARWFGVSDSQLTDVFPNLGNFNERWLGFMG